MNNLNIFLPAAGLGERLRPITYHTPKPLLPIIGRPLIEHIIEKFSQISSGRIGINLHYKAEMLREWAMNSAFSERIELFYEYPILGTGGALKNAEIFLSSSHFIVHNSDIVSDADLSKLIETHFYEGNIATLVTHDYPKYNNVVLDDNGLVIDVENAGTSMPNPCTSARKTAYTGIAIYSPEILKFLPEGVSHATVAWLMAAEAGHRVKALDFTGCYWNDIGTPSAYASAIIDTLRSDGETIYIHHSSNGCKNIQMDGFIAIERDCTFDKGAYLRNSIVLEGSRIEGGEHENCIIGIDFKIQLNENEILGVGKENDLILIGTGGSDRKYYRAKDVDKNVVLVKYAKDDPDFKRHVEYTVFFMKHWIPVPGLIRVDHKNMTAVFEDLGDLSLYLWFKCERDDDVLEDMYRKVLDIAVSIHSNVFRDISGCPLLQERIFDYAHFRWETDYFLERFVKQIAGIELEDIEFLNDELNRLAAKADSYPKRLVHRDFQSQNIMIKNGMPRLIDYQGARVGPPAYDIASMLWDPYYRLDEAVRERLLCYYIKMISASDARFNEDEFMDSLSVCRLQRHMQALGAYGFLSLVKGKKYFIKHITPALEYLREEIMPFENEYPSLYKLIGNLNLLSAARCV